MRSQSFGLEKPNPPFEYLQKNRKVKDGISARLPSHESGSRFKSTSVDASLSKEQHSSWVNGSPRSHPDASAQHVEQTTNHKTERCDYDASTTHSTSVTCDHLHFRTEHSTNSQPPQKTRLPSFSSSFGKESDCTKKRISRNFAEPGFAHRSSPAQGQPHASWHSGSQLHQTRAERQPHVVSSSQPQQQHDSVHGTNSSPQSPHVPHSIVTHHVSKMMQEAQRQSTQAPGHLFETLNSPQMAPIQTGASTHRFKQREYSLHTPIDRNTSARLLSRHTPVTPGSAHSLYQQQSLPPRNASQQQPPPNMPEARSPSPAASTPLSLMGSPLARYPHSPVDSFDRQVSTPGSGGLQSHRRHHYPITFPTSYSSGSGANAHVYYNDNVHPNNQTAMSNGAVSPHENNAPSPVVRQSAALSPQHQVPVIRECISNDHRCKDTPLTVVNPRPTDTQVPVKRVASKPDLNGLSVAIRPSRRKGVGFSVEFPSSLCSSPHKYQIRFRYPNQSFDVGKLSDQIYLETVRSQQRIMDGCSIGKKFYTLSTKMPQHNVETYELKFTTNSYKHGKEDFRLIIGDMFVSTPFKIVARKPKEKNDFWLRFRNLNLWTDSCSVKESKLMERVPLHLSEKKSSSPPPSHHLPLRKRKRPASEAHTTHKRQRMAEQRSATVKSSQDPLCVLFDTMTQQKDKSKKASGLSTLAYVAERM